MPTPIITKTNIITEFVTNITELTNTNFITETINQTAIKSMPLDVWTILGTMATLASAGFMAWSIHEMREQYKQQKKDTQYREEKQEKDTQYREDKKELREYIEKNLIPKIENLKKYGIITSNNVPIQDIKSFNVYSFLCLSHLNNYSPGSFYRDSLKEIFNKIEIYFPIIKYPKEYSNKIIKCTYVLLHNISIDLYKALIDEPTFFKVINRIDSDVNQLEGKLTPEEKIKLKLYKAQNTTK